MPTNDVSACGRPDQSGPFFKCAPMPPDRRPPKTASAASEAAAKTPRVSIGMPLYNAERYLRETLESVLSQTYREFELIISDNGSTDSTDAICREYAAKDSRIRYYRNEENRGAAWNFNYVLALASGEYFKWAAYDDLMAPAFLERCLEALDRDRSAVLSFSRFLDIDDEGAPQTEKGSESCHIGNMRERMRAIMRLNYLCEEVFGLIRTDILKKTPGIGAYTSSDQNLLMELALYGPFVEIADVLFYHRWHARSSCIVHPDNRQRWLWFDPKAAVRFRLPLWRQFNEFRASIGRSPLSWKDRLKCYADLAGWFTRYKKYLLMEAFYIYKEALIYFLDSRLPSVRRIHSLFSGKKNCAAK